ncbi:MAG: biopolymer transporter ExbD, partial [Burkholderiaceae bacterium]|nr:biopolymer transporter ExbD [Burkholderiaceae bacterium]
AASQSEPPRFVTLAIDKAGQAYIDDQPVSQPELAAALLATAHANPDAEVRLRADQSVPYARVFEVMNEAQKAGLNRIGFVAEASGAAPTVPAPARPAPGS